MNRREFLAGLGGVALMPVAQSTLKLGVINDEITQDLDHALAVARELGLEFVELRAMWNKNLMDLKEDEVKEARRLLTKYGIRVSDIASPFMKVDAPGVTAKEGERDTF